MGYRIQSAVVASQSAALVYPSAMDISFKLHLFMQSVIETERLIIRELLPSDDLGMFELDNDADVHRYLGNKPVQTLEEAQEMIRFIRQQYATNGIGRWAIIEKRSKDFVGWTGLKWITDTINQHSNFYDIGYRLVKRHWGKGFATESAKACLDYGFNQLGLDKIYAMADVNNQASNKVLRNLGLSFVETFMLDESLHNWYEIERPD